MNNDAEGCADVIGTLVILILILVLIGVALSLNPSGKDSGGIPVPTFTPLPHVVINDQIIVPEERDFKIACDYDKKLGIVYFVVSKDLGYDSGYAYSPSGVLVGEYYDKFCMDAK